MECPQCHQPNKEGAKFCRGCGMTLTAPPASDAGAASAQAQAIAQAIANAQAVAQAVIQAHAPAPAHPPAQVQPPAPVQPAAQVRPPAPVQPAAQVRPPAPVQAQPAHWLSAATAAPATGDLRAVYLRLLIGAAICFIALFFEWFPGHVNVVAGGITYVRGSTSDYAPQFFTSGTGGSNGLQASTVLPLLFLGFVFFRYRAARPPRWVRYTMLGAVALLGFGLWGLLNYFAFGPLLYWVGYALVAWSAWQIYKRTEESEGGRSAA